MNIPSLSFIEGDLLTVVGNCIGNAVMFFLRASGQVKNDRNCSTSVRTGQAKAAPETALLSSKIIL